MAESAPKTVHSVALDNYEHIVSGIPVNEVLRKLISRQIITLSNKQEIKSEKSDVLQAEALLDKFILNRVSGGEDEVFFTFLEVLQETGKCSNLVAKIYSDLNMTPPPANVSNGQEVDDTPVYEDDPKVGKRLRGIVVPRISANWDTIGAFLEIPIPTIREIGCRYRGDPRECCTKLLEDWFHSDVGVTPKSWEKLVEVLSDIPDIAASTVQIKRLLREEGAIK